MTVDRVEVLRADVTTLDVDAIVNAANVLLAPGGGVCGAIHRVAGPDLAGACGEVGPCPTGEARITPGFLLQAKYVIHAVGPVWQGGTEGEAELLAGCYRHSLELARDHELGSIAFPAISTGIFGYPLEAACEVAAHAISDFVAANEGPARVMLCALGERTERALRDAFQR